MGWARALGVVLVGVVCTVSCGDDDEPSTPAAGSGGDAVSGGAGRGGAAGVSGSGGSAGSAIGEGGNSGAAGSAGEGGASGGASAGAGAGGTAASGGASGAGAGGGADEGSAGAACQADAIVSCMQTGTGVDVCVEAFDETAAQEVRSTCEDGVIEDGNCPQRGMYVGHCTDTGTTATYYYTLQLGAPRGFESDCVDAGGRWCAPRQN